MIGGVGLYVSSYHFAFLLLSFFIHLCSYLSIETRSDFDSDQYLYLLNMLELSM